MIRKFRVSTASADSTSPELNVRVMEQATPLSIWIAATCAGIATHEMVDLGQSAGEPKSGFAVFGLTQDSSFVTTLRTRINERAAGVGLRMAGEREGCVGELHCLKGERWSSKCSRRAVEKKRFAIRGEWRAAMRGAHGSMCSAKRGEK